VASAVLQEQALSLLPAEVEAPLMQGWQVPSAAL
jgi:hypothetical protein